MCKLQIIQILWLIGCCWNGVRLAPISTPFWIKLPSEPVVVSISGEQAGYLATLIRWLRLGNLYKTNTFTIPTLATFFQPIQYQQRPQQQQQQQPQAIPYTFSSMKYVSS